MSTILFFTRTLWRSGLLKAFLFLLLLSIFASFMLSSANIGQPYKLFWDLLLFVQAFWLHALALLWAYELAKNEQLLRLARLPLSAPLSRSRYEASRFFALALAFLPLLLPLAAINAVLANGMVAWQGALFGLSALLVGFLALMLARFFAPISAMLYATALLVVGNGVDELYLYATLQAEGGVLKPLSQLLYIALPNFSLFDRQSAAVAGNLIDLWAFFALPVFYFLFLGGAFFALSVWRFKKMAI